MFSSCVADVQMTSSLLKESRRVFWISKFSWHFWPLISADSDRLRNFASFFKLMNLLLQRIWNKLRGSKNFLKQIEAHFKKTKEKANLETNLKRIWNKLGTDFNKFEVNLWISKEEGEFITAKNLCQFEKS